MDLRLRKFDMRNKKDDKVVVLIGKTQNPQKKFSTKLILN